MNLLNSRPELQLRQVILNVSVWQPNPDRLLPQDPLTAQSAEAEFRGRPILYISELKTVKPDVPESAMDSLLLEHMSQQWAIHNAIEPVKSMLTFRLPWGNGTTDYLKGATKGGGGEVGLAEFSCFPSRRTALPRVERHHHDGMPLAAFLRH